MLGRRFIRVLQRVQAAQHVQKAHGMAGVPLREGAAHVQRVCNVMLRHLAQGLAERHTAAQEDREAEDQRAYAGNANEEKGNCESVQSSGDESTEASSRRPGYCDD